MCKASKSVFIAACLLLLANIVFVWIKQIADMLKSYVRRNYFSECIPDNMQE